jgi:ribonuclease P protein component
MLPRELRLRQAGDFARLRQEGRTVSGRWMVLSARPNGMAHNRYGFIVSRRVGKAVERNRARRVMREGVRQLHLRLVSGYDIALIARTALTEQPLSAVLPEMTRLCAQAGLMKA